MSEVDPYKLLGFRLKCDDQTVIKRHYRQLAKKHHPDNNPGDEEAAARFREITEAYELLSDPVRKAHYDRTGEWVQATNKAEEHLELVDVLGQFVTKVGRELAGQGTEPGEVDFLDRVKAAIHAQIRTHNEKITELRDGVSWVKEIIERSVGPEGEPNLIAEAAQENLNKNEAAAKASVEEVLVFEKLLDILSRHGFRWEWESERARQARGPRYLRPWRE